MTTDSKRVLLVDDDPAILNLLRALFQNEYLVAEARSGEEALAMLMEYRPHLVILDIMMPGIDGYETCRCIRMSPNGGAIQVVMVSAKSSRPEMDLAFAVGADDYVIKPFDPLELCSRVHLHLRLRRALDVASEQTSDYGSMLPLRSYSGNLSADELSHAYDITVGALTKVAEFRDAETGDHLVRMRAYTQILAEELSCRGPYCEQIDDQFLDDLFRASPLHDIGKIGIPDAILLKPGRLTQVEYEVIKRHTIIGAHLLEHVASGAPAAGFLRMAATIARFHHERFDGFGYPAGLIGSEIPLPARIVALADAYDAITSIRTYKDAVPPQLAKVMVEGDSGRHFDPAVVEAFQSRFGAIVRLQEQVEDRWSVVQGAQAFMQSELLNIGTE